MRRVGVAPMLTVSPRKPELEARRSATGSARYSQRLGNLCPIALIRRATHRAKPKANNSRSSLTGSFQRKQFTGLGVALQLRRILFVQGHEPNLCLFP